MLITKFNKMIRNRIVWAVVATVVSVSFVLSFSSFRGCDAATPNTIGELYGEPVVISEFNRARYFEMGLRSDRGLTPDAERRVRANTWKRLVVMRTAERLGITTPDKEIGQALRQDPTFSVGGVFDKDRYGNIVRSQLGVDIATFEEYLRQNMTMQKVMRLMGSIVWTSPMELNERLRNLTDGMQLDIALLPPPQAPDDIDLDAGAARELYEADPERYTIPELVSVRYVAFPFTNFVSTNAISEDRVLDAYDARLAEFTPTPTNELDVPLPTPLEEVRPTIEDMLRAEDAAFAAKDHATDFVVALAPDRRGQSLDMETVAADRGHVIHTTDYFSASEPVPGLDVSPEFRRVGFSLIPGDPESYFSDAILGSNTVYVIATNAFKAARVPSFEEAESRVIPDARIEAAARAFDARAAEVRAAVIEAMATNRPFAIAAADYGMTVSTTDYFTVYASLGTNVFAESQAIIPMVIELREGEVTEWIDVAEGRVLSHVARRVSGDPGDIYALRPQLLSTLQDYRSGILYDVWSTYLLDQAGFKDLRAYPARPAETEDSEDNPDEADDL